MTYAEINLFERARECLMERDIAKKIALLDDLVNAASDGVLSRKCTEVCRIEVPGRPDNPVLVAPGKVPRRGFDTVAGRVRFTHAIAHIEFNAINLALDAVYRFQDMPEEYYLDWLQVAHEEAKHFSLLSAYLQDHGSYYGEFEAHNGLWEMALKTDKDVEIRMALVPRVLEARGLDVTPGMIDKLRIIGDDELVSILKVIHREEIGHVRIGTRWFNHVCEERGDDPAERFSDLLDEYMKGASFGPFDHPSRLQAGFSEEEMQGLVARSERV